MKEFPRLKKGVAVLATILVAAFIASFVAGLRSGREGGRAAGAAAPSVLALDRRIRVEILNAAGRGGLAREATRRLRAGGFDVVHFGNAREFGLEESVVIDRAGDAEAAARVAAELGIAEVRSEPDPEIMLEATVLLGLDWAPPVLEAPEGVRERVGRLWRRVVGGG